MKEWRLLNLLILSGWIPYSSSLFTKPLWDGHHSDTTMDNRPSIQVTSIKHDYHAWLHGWHKAQMGVQYDKYQQAGSLYGNSLEGSQGWNLQVQTGHHPLLEKHMLFFLLGGGIMGFRIPNLSHLQLEVVQSVPFHRLKHWVDWGIGGRFHMRSPASHSAGHWDPGHSRQCQAYEETPRDSGSKCHQVCVVTDQGDVRLLAYWCGSLVTLQLLTTNYSF